MSNAA
jgi:CRP-like cAMP-binding protein